VGVVAGDRFRQLKGLPIPRAVKIDVEGHEYAVLQGLHDTLSQPACELVCCEVHPKLLPSGRSLETVSGLLESLGFAHRETHRRYDVFHVVAWKGGLSTTKDEGSPA
jgi:methyltransferase FkbM-like protein